MAYDGYFFSALRTNRLPIRQTLMIGYFRFFHFLYYIYNFSEGISIPVQVQSFRFSARNDQSEYVNIF